MKKITLIASTLLGIISFSANSHATTLVDTELSLLVDVSGSVNSQEYSLQIQGYIDAFKNIDFTGSSLAANFIVWSDRQDEVVPWTLINDNATASAFGDAIAAALLPESKRPFGGNTAPGSAINFTVPIFGTETGGVDNGFTSTRQIIDISGDGSQNTGANTAAARDAALAAGIDAINGLPILTDEPNLDDWYQNNIVGGTNSFLQVASDFPDFASAISTKIAREICNDPDGCEPPPAKTPEPTTMLGLLGFGAFGASTLKRKEKQQAET